MKISSLVAVLSAAALTAGTLPVLAEGETLPAACGGKAPVLAEGETLVENTLYLRGTSRVGNVDQVDDFSTLGISDKKFMSAEAPTSADTKYDALAAATNPNFAGNPNMAYWRYLLEQETRIVCAGATFFGAAQGTLTAKLFVDQAWGSTDVAASKIATATGSDSIKTFTANFGVIAQVPADNLLLQIAPSAAGAVAYDSTAHPSSFTYVTVAPAAATVEPAPVP